MTGALLILTVGEPPNADPRRMLGTPLLSSHSDELDRANPLAEPTLRAAASMGKLLRYYAVDPALAERAHAQDTGSDTADSCSVADLVDRSLANRTPLITFVRALVHGQAMVDLAAPGARAYEAPCMAVESILLKSVKLDFVSLVANWLGAAARDTGAHGALWEPLTHCNIATSRKAMETKLKAELAALGDPTLRLFRPEGATSVDNFGFTVRSEGAGYKLFVTRAVQVPACAHPHPSRARARARARPSHARACILITIRRLSTTTVCARPAGPAVAR